VANFVDGRKFLGISGQLVHVAVRGATHIGLRRGFALDGTPLTVESDSPGIVRVQPARTHGDIRMFTLIGVDIGDAVVKAVAKDGTVSDRIEVHVHRPRVRQLPKFDDLFENYAGDEESSDDFRKRIGGQADNPQITNTCTLRMSEAFNGAGQPIPHAHKGMITVRGGDKHFYAIRVAEFKRYMLDHYGPPDIVRGPPAGAKEGVLRDAFAHLMGVICFEVHFNDATGHFTLWDGTDAVHGDYFDRAFRVSLWMAG
jgi:hypothetical protein